jgi:hypothetical protein
VPLLVLGLSVLLALEASLRVARFGLAGVSRPLEHMAPRFPSGDCLESGPTGEPLRPNCSMHYKGARIETNALGLNDRGVEEERPHFRVAVVGDSFTMAAGVDPRRSYHALLEERISRDLGAPGFVELYNLGRGGRSTGDELRDFEWIQQRRELDGVLVALYRNDPWDNLRSGQTCRAGDEELQLSQDERAWYERHVVAQNPATSLAAWLERWTGLWIFDRLGDFFARAALRVRDRPDPAAFAVLEEKSARLFGSCARAIRDRARASGIPILFVDLTYHPHPDSERMRREVEELGEPLLSMSHVHEAFEDPSELQIYPGDAHPSAEVHRLYAERLIAWLDELGWIGRMRAAHVGDEPGAS